MIESAGHEVRLAREYSENVFQPAVLAHLATCFDGLYEVPSHNKSKPVFGTIGEPGPDPFPAEWIDSSKEYLVGMRLETANEPTLSQFLSLGQFERSFRQAFEKEEGVSLLFRALPYLRFTDDGDGPSFYARTRFMRCGTGTVREFVERGRLIPVTINPRAVGADEGE